MFVAPNGWERFLKFMPMNAIYTLHSLKFLTVKNGVMVM